MLSFIWKWKIIQRWKSSALYIVCYWMEVRRWSFVYSQAALLTRNGNKSWIPRSSCVEYEMIWLSNNFCLLVCSLSFFRNEFDDARPHQVQHQREGHCRETKGLMSGTTTHCCLFHVYFEISICEYWLQILTFYWTSFFSFSFVSSMWSLCKWYFLGRVFISLRKKLFCLVYLILITPNFLKKTSRKP